MTSFLTAIESIKSANQSLTPLLHLPPHQTNHTYNNNNNDNNKSVVHDAAKKKANQTKLLDRLGQKTTHAQKKKKIKTPKRQVRKNTLLIACSSFWQCRQATPTPIQAHTRVKPTDPKPNQTRQCTQLVVPILKSGNPKMDVRVEGQRFWQAQERQERALDTRIYANIITKKKHGQRVVCANRDRRKNV